MTVIKKDGKTVFIMDDDEEEGEEAQGPQQTAVPTAEEIRRNEKLESSNESVRPTLSTGTQATVTVRSPKAYWLGKGQLGTGEYHRRSVQELRQLHVGFAGHAQILTLAERAKRFGDVLDHRDGVPTGTRDAAFVAALFVTGARISETVYGLFEDKNGRRVPYGLNRNDIKHDPRNHRYIFTLRVLKKRVRVPVGFDETKNRPVYESRRNTDFLRVFPVPDNEPELPYLMKWVEECPNRDGFLFKFSDMWGRIILDRASGGFVDGQQQQQQGQQQRVKGSYFPHRLRFERASQLSTEYKMSSDALRRFFEWSTEQEAILYAGKTVEDLWASMRAGIEGGH